MKLTAEVVKHLYASLYCCYPFTKWKMPLPEEIEFIVTADPEVMGTYLLDAGEDYEHTVTISSGRCGHYYTMLTTLAHMVFELVGRHTNLLEINCGNIPHRDSDLC